MSDLWVGEHVVPDLVIRERSARESLLRKVEKILWAEAEYELAARAGGPWQVGVFSLEWHYDHRHHAEVARLTCEIVPAQETDDE